VVAAAAAEAAAVVVVVVETLGEAVVRWHVEAARTGTHCRLCSWSFW
jgi:hypothetical protein